MEILRVENLVKTYGQGDNVVNAVDNISLSVNKGEFVAIVGASGSGKSTLLHLLGGVDRPTSGGIVYQFYNLIPILTVEENISLPCDLDGNRPDKERMNLILKSFGLFDRRNHLPNELSGGQQQRTSIARALINNPAILLADEPTGNLDSKSTEEIMSILKMSNRDFNQTIIMITHNLEIAKEADRIITIQDGKIVKEA